MSNDSKNSVRIARLEKRADSLTEQLRSVQRELAFERLRDNEGRVSNEIICTYAG